MLPRLIRQVYDNGDKPVNPPFNGQSNECSIDNAPSLIQFVMKGLDTCWMNEHNRWSHSYTLDDRHNQNVSLPHSDVFYTLNVILGLSRSLKYVKRDYDMERIFHENARLVPKLKSPLYSYGMILWAGAVNKFALPLDLIPLIDDIVNDDSKHSKYKAQDLGMLLTGCVAQAAAGNLRYVDSARILFDLLSRRFACESGLFRNSAAGVRGNFSSFATHVYLGLASYHFGEYFGDRNAIALGNKVVDKLIDLQGSNGEWPWFYHSPSGRVVDIYEVFSVHQHGMAPALLEYGEKHGVSRSADARAKGFRWILGYNELNVSMLRPDVGLIYRSQVRQAELSSKWRRGIRATFPFFAPRGAELVGPKKVTIRKECRSYELGWTLWSFGDRDDLRYLSDKTEFAAGTAFSK